MLHEARTTKVIPATVEVDSEKFSLVEQDRYINIDGKGIWFTEES